MGKTKNIAWVVDGECIRTLEESLREYGCTVEKFRNTIPALRAFDERRYDGIILNTRVGPGVIKDEKKGITMGYEKGPYDNDPRIEQIMKEYKHREGIGNTDYWKLAIYVIEVAHRVGSPNERTPIFVAGTHDDGEDPLFPDAKETCKRAGAEYYNLISDQRYAALIRDIKKLQ
jgi:hypothetical protein